MTYLTNNKIPDKKRQQQAGISLLLAVLVLAGITAVAFSIAAIVFVEIRASGDLLRTEPALYAVQSVTEEAFYSTSRSIDNFPFSTSINGVSLATAERAYDASPQTYVVYYNTSTKFSLANSAAPFQNSYTTVKIDYVSPATGTTVTAQLYQYQDNGQTGIVATQVLNSSASSWTITLASYANSANSEFEIVLTTSNPNNSTVLITSTRTGTPSSGLPLLGRKTYDVTASYLGLTRKYTVGTPLPGAAGSGSSQTFTASAGFSSSQGNLNWYYMDNNGVLMTYDSANGVWVGLDGLYHYLGSSWGHPGVNGRHAVRQWRAPSAGNIRITGSAYDMNAGCGDGVIVTVSKNSTILWQRTINNGDATGFSYDLTTPVSTGDQINFGVNPIANYGCDSTAFDPTIVLTP